MSHKSISFLKALKHVKGVVLTWYKATPFFNEDSDSEFSEFTIYRKSCSSFKFGDDYQEYFCDVQPEGADLIYQGPVDCSNKRKYMFVDNSVKTGCVYTYFIRSKNSSPVGPVPVKVRDSEVWWNYDELQRRINLLCSTYPDKVTQAVCGNTVEGRNIFSLQIGSGEPFLGLVGAIHAGEAGPELIISALDIFLQSNPEILETRSIIVVPSVNIDMRERLATGTPWYLRTNAAGVDLNRNFPAEWDVVAKGYGLSSDDRDSMTYRGGYAASEPETRSVLNLFSENTPRCIFSFHALAGICDLPALAAGGVDQSNKEFYELVEQYASAYGTGLHPDLTPDESWYYFGGTEGGLARWSWQKLGIPGFDLELSATIAPEALAMCKADKTTPALLNEYSEKHANAIKNIMNMP